MMNRRRLEAAIFVWPPGSAVLLKSRFARYFESLLLFDMKVATPFRTLLHLRVASSNASRWQASSQNLSRPRRVPLHRSRLPFFPAGLAGTTTARIHMRELCAHQHNLR